MISMSVSEVSFNDCETHSFGILETHNCRGNTKCKNKYGGFTCIPCPSGMEPNAHRTDCIDIDECKHDICHPNASCQNIPGSYNCKCNAGFSGDGNWCQDIDECVTGKILSSIFMNIRVLSLIRNYPIQVEGWNELGD